MPGRIGCELELVKARKHSATLNRSIFALHQGAESCLAQLVLERTDSGVWRCRGEEHERVLGPPERAKRPDVRIEVRPTVGFEPLVGAQWNAGALSEVTL